MDTIPFVGFSVWFIVKIFFLFGLALYIIFATVIVRQVDLMVGTVKIGFQSLAKLLSFVHLAFAVLVFLFALIIL